MKNIKLVTVTLTAIMSLSGCSAVGTAIKKRNLEVKTVMSDTIWLDPVSSDKHTVYLQVKNTTDKAFSIDQELSQKLNTKGYSVVSDPDRAHYWVQANILKMDKMDLREAQGFLGGGYGSALTGGGLAALAVAANTSHSNSIAGAGLIGAAIGFAADAIVEDVNYTMITDIRVVERTTNKVVNNDVAALSNGNAGTLNSSSSTEEYLKRYQTRIMSNANKVNLDFTEAQPALIDGLTTSISGLF